MTKSKKNAPKLDLASLDTKAASDKGFDLELKHPTTTEPLGMFVSVLGKHSEVYREIISENQDASMRKAQVYRRKGTEPPAQTTAEIEAKALNLLVACTTGWFTIEDGERRDTILFEGEEIPFNVANALKVYSRLLWVRKQVDDAIDDLENFI